MKSRLSKQLTAAFAALMLAFVLGSVLRAQGHRWTDQYHDVILFLWNGSNTQQVAGDTSGNIYVKALGATNVFAGQSAVGQTATFDTVQVVANHTTELIVTGAPATCTYRLQGSTDSVTWFDISAADLTCTASVTAFENSKPARYVRGNLKTLTGGTSPTVTLKFDGY